MRSQPAAVLQDFHRRLLQIDDSATTVNAAPLANANATSSVTPSSSSDDSPHTILEDVISAYKAKFGKGPAPAPVTVSATANATADSSSDSSDLYSTPCSAGPIPSQYEAFVEVCCCL